MRRGAGWLVLAGSVFAAPVAAQESSAQLATNGMNDDLVFGLYAIFSEVNFTKVAEDESSLLPNHSSALGLRVGAVFGFAGNGVRIIPSLTLDRRSGFASNSVADIDSGGDLVGADVSVLAPVSDIIDLSVGAGVGGGSHDLIFNGSAVPSTTELSSYFINAGIIAEIYRDETVRLTIGDQIGFHHLHADYDPINSVDEGTARVLENRLSLSGSYALSADTTLNGDVSLVHLLEAEALPGEDAYDRTYGVLSLGASHDIGDAATLYGRAGVVVGGSRQGSVLGQIGIRTYF